MGVRTILTEEVPERGTSQYQCDFTSEAAAVLGAADLDTLTLTLYHEPDKAIINSVSAINVLNVGRGSFHVTTKRFTLRLTGADHQVLDTTHSRETHVALLRWTYGTDGAGWHEIEYTVVNNPKVS